MTGNKFCVNLLRYAPQVYPISNPSADVYSSINIHFLSNSKSERDEEQCMEADRCHIRKHEIKLYGGRHTINLHVCGGFQIKRYGGHH